MAKDKKKKHKKDDVSEDILDVAALSIKKFRKVTKEIGKLSTGQKLVGGIALVAAGLTYLATQDGGATPSAKAKDAEDNDSGPAHLLAGRSADDAEPTPARHKSRKAPKAKSASRSESED
ncbi:hypothetical protein ACFST9_21370 [Hymenobacter monticola]|uniref:Uncharacterized protein n=1 Tax=Hymenobacter monticola TaxID=1705399 RepID=A0ABY4B5Q2_9BACT|nr:hypothetical protein [Hymenobacter monticola]UOE34350.1 hypothetical protein MTP16_01540 [Hymenobacter monticola]